MIAYKQPITALEITEIRGVNTSGVLTTLLERHLIKIVGRKNVVGRPFLYSTTREFLIRFGLKDLADLPKIEDMADALGFNPPAGLLEVTPREDMLPLEEPAESRGDDRQRRVRGGAGAVVRSARPTVTTTTSPDGGPVVAARCGLLPLVLIRTSASAASPPPASTRAIVPAAAGCR